MQKYFLYKFLCFIFRNLADSKLLCKLVVSENGSYILKKTSAVVSMARCVSIFNWSEMLCRGITMLKCTKAALLK